MAIRWDPLLAAAVARELSRLLTGDRVRGLLFDPVGRVVLAFLDGHTLVFELHPDRGWLTRLPPRAPTSGSAPLSGRIRRVEVLPDEPILLIEFGGGRKGAPEGTLVVEWVGSRWNALLTEGEARTVRRILLPPDRGKRALTVGSPYHPPTPTGRAGIDGTLSLAEWEGIVGGSDRPFAERRRALLSGIAWSSSRSADALSSPEGWALWRAWSDPAQWGAYILRGTEGNHPYPVALPGAGAEAATSLLEAMEGVRAEAPDALPLPALLLPPELRRGAEERLRRAERRAAALRRELSDGGDPVALRGEGDLILAHFRKIPRGAERVRLLDFSGVEIEIALDPTLPPQGNAAKRYGEAARIERAREALPGRIEDAEAEAARWRALLREAVEGEGSAESLARALGPEGPPRPKGISSSRPALPYRPYLSSGGLEIRVGKGARQNDDLTFRHSAPDDIWLHALQVPGAHVILRWGRAEGPPQSDLVEAATLAALYSEARSSGSVPVAWTRRKHVRKPRKSPPGSVLPERVRTLMVEPDPAVEARLRSGPLPA